MRNPLSVVCAAACLAFLLPIAGCDQGKTDEAAPKSGAAAKTPAAKKPAKPVEQPKVAKAPTSAAPTSAAGAVPDTKVTLLEAGADPKQELRLKLKNGDSVTAEMIMKMAMKMELNGMKPPEVPLPPTRMLMKMEVTDAQANLFAYTFEVTEAAPMDAQGVQPMVMNAMKTALKNAVGLKGKGSIDAQGMNKGASFELPPNMDPQTRQLMDGMRDAVGRMSAPLPTEAVGVGGKWKVDQTLVQNGMTVNQTATYTIKSIAGDTIELDVTVAMDAPAQEVKAPGMPPGSKMHLESMTGSGTGKTTQVLTSLLPQLAEVGIDTAMKSTIEAMGQKQKMSMNMKMDVTIKPQG